MKHSKEWYRKNAELEGNSEIGAGVPPMKKKPSKTKPVRYCRMCRHYRRDMFIILFGNYEFAQCHHPSCFSSTTTPPDLVSGKSKTAIRGPGYCDIERNCGCGLDGKNFEPRRKWWKLWLA